MYESVFATPLMQVLKAKKTYYNRVRDLRKRVGVYARGIPETFSQYTSHAVDHSDQIVRQISRMLYDDTSDQRPSGVRLNAVEVYLLVCSIYLHDLGMVVTDREKFEVLESEAWRQFVAKHNFVDADMELLRRDLQHESSATPDQELFLLSMKQRLLLGEFFRAQHAVRAGLTLTNVMKVKEDFLSSDSAAARTVEAICAGHGLERAELLSSAEYPLRRDIWDKPVNVRLLTVLLRIGDLLDMRSDRACSILESLASPLPPSSIPHWSQYDRIFGGVVSPEIVEVEARCETAAEHRLLADWCNWIVDELADAPRLLRGSDARTTWQPPRAELDGAYRTIKIERAPGARYRHEQWKFDFDEAQIVQRLVRDVHNHPLGFLRELLQNALDTSRAAVLGVANSGERYPNLLPVALRSAHKVQIVCEIDQDQVTAVTVSDHGMGMTEEIVRNYFLQIGRSWYKSSAFEREYKFAPTSRFGIGFLSVFAVSDDVTVLTRWWQADEDQALNMHLHGPRSYLIFEDADRADAGTSVRVVLRDSVPVESVRQFMHETCVAVEFPVELVWKSGDVEERVEPVGAIDEEYASLVLSPESRIVTRRVRVDQPPVWGEWVFMVLESERDLDDWSLRGFDLERRVTRVDPLGSAPELPFSWSAVNGLAVSPRFDRARDVSWRLDVRSAESARTTGLARNEHSARPAVAVAALEAALHEHVAARSDPKYVAALVRKFEDVAPGWAATAEWIELLDGTVVSMTDLLSAESFWWLMKVTSLESLMQRSRGDKQFDLVGAIEQLPELARSATADSWKLLSMGQSSRLTRRPVRRAIDVGGDTIALEFETVSAVASGGSRWALTSFNSESTVVSIRPKAGVALLLNQEHPLVSALIQASSSVPSIIENFVAAVRTNRSPDRLEALLDAAFNATGDRVIGKYKGLAKRASIDYEILRLPML